MRTADLTEFTKIAINKSWQLREDFDYHVGLKFMEEQHAPPKNYPATLIKRPDYNLHLQKAGGNFFCSPSVALIAGYWAIHEKPFQTITYFGCDLVFNRFKNRGKTHFYGVSDQGPLFNKHPCMARQDLKAVRLFVWGLLHRVLLLNASAEEGTLLPFPVTGLNSAKTEIHQLVFANPVFNKLLELGMEALAFEADIRTPAFEGRWKSFAEDEDAVSRLNDSLSKWEPVQDLCAELNVVVSASGLNLA